mgnify:CR=1 FL=1|jgi:hypothetical protein
MAKRMLPKDPLTFIRQCIKERKLWWTYHINMRLKQRRISRKDIISSTAVYEVINEYPDDKYFPSYLIYSRYEDVIFHILFAVDVEGDNVRIVTAYYPDPEEWESDLKTRRTTP